MSAPAGDQVRDDLEGGLTTLANWVVRHDVQTEVSRRARCPVPTSHVWVVNRIAATGPCRPSELADYFGVDNSTMTPKLRRLLLEGLVYRQEDPADRRAVLLAVSPGGTRLLARLRRARAEMLEEKLRGLPPDRRAALATSLQELAGLLQGEDG
jgi:DNA-binding MarR family transcriptional regulator